jgi:hypothetical protein
VSDPKTLASALAGALLDGPWTPAPMAARAEEVVGGRPPWLFRLVGTVRRKFRKAPHGSAEALAGFLEYALKTRLDLHRWPSPYRFSLGHPKMGPRRWPVPALPTAGDLAAFLGLDPALLDALADRKGLGRFARDEPLRSYRYRWFPKRSGGCRLLEVPKPRLREVQRRILHGILDRIPPHALAHGFAPGRGLLGFAQPHCGRALLLSLDLENFFNSVGAGRVFGLFHAAGYPEKVARILTALCTHRTPAEVQQRAPAEVARSREERLRVLQRLAMPHLPQGAPTSPALANLVAYRLDVRLAAAAAAIGARYTRYADDLAFSFDEDGARRAGRFHLLAGGIALDEAFDVQFRKTRFSRRGAAQRLAGLVVNDRPNVPRTEYDRLKAMLHRAVHIGPAAVVGLRNIEPSAALLGRITWVEQTSPARGKKLRALFERVDWGRSAPAV